MSVIELFWQLVLTQFLCLYTLLMTSVKVQCCIFLVFEEQRRLKPGGNVLVSVLLGAQAQVMLRKGFPDGRRV